MTDLVTRQEIKDFLSIANTNQDSLIDRLITAASRACDQLTNRSLCEVTRTEKFSGTGSSLMMLTNYPVTAISAVTVDGTAVLAAATTLAAGFRFDEVSIFRNLGVVWTEGIKNVSISYTSGYAAAAVPEDLKQACIEITCARLRDGSRFNLTTQGIAGQQVSYSLKQIPESAHMVLNNYVRRWMA